MPKNKANQKKLSNNLIYIKKQKYSKKKILALCKMKYDALYLFGDRCMSCGCKENIELDHIYPVSRYPEKAFKFSNIQLLCKICNIHKNNKNIIDFRPNIKKYELWNSNQKKMFKYLIKVEKRLRPIKMPKFMYYKGTLDDYFKGEKEERVNLKINSVLMNKFLDQINYTLKDVLMNKTDKFIDFHEYKLNQCKIYNPVY